MKKANLMDASELKLKIIKEINSLETGKLKEVYGYLQNIIQGEKDIHEWESLSPAQKKGIKEAMDDIEAGKGVLNEDVISKYRDKYRDA